LTACHEQALVHGQEAATSLKIAELTSRLSREQCIANGFDQRAFAVTVRRAEGWRMRYSTFKHYTHARTLPIFMHHTRTRGRTRVHPTKSHT